MKNLERATTIHALESLVEITEPELASKPLEEEENVKPIPLYRLFRFATRTDHIYMTIGTIAAMLNGVGLPLFSLLIGNSVDSLGPKSPPEQVVAETGKLSLMLLGLGIGTLLVAYIGFSSWMITGERQAIEFRKRYFRSLLRQEIEFYDKINPNELSSKVSEECFRIQKGLGEKVALLLYSLAQFSAGFIIGFIKGWQLTLVVAVVIPLIAISGSFYVHYYSKSEEITSELYLNAGSIAEESLSAIRTVTSLVGQEKEIQRFKKALSDNKFLYYKICFYTGVAQGVTFFALYIIFTLSFYIGAVFINKQVSNTVTKAPYSGGDVLTVFYCVCYASYTLSQVTPSVKAITSALVAAAKAYKIIDKKSKISAEKNGLKLAKIDGNVTFKNVSFNYPLKPDKIILDGVSFEIKMNEKTALVGESGCGKTTCMQLIERFYDTKQGSVQLDGLNIGGLDLTWLRSIIGYVGQEPVLFATSIRENLIMAKEDATDEEIWTALDQARASEFVNSMPDKLETFVGTNGAQLSGGQKQKLAIARAILKSPIILLLDEATSALDRKNEIDIQKTLDEISKGRTTIVIAHRLSTIQNADRIIVFDQGKIVEEGKHDELLEKNGKYYELQKLQLKETDEKEKNKDTAAPGGTLAHMDDPPVEEPFDKIEKTSKPPKMELPKTFAHPGSLDSIKENDDVEEAADNKDNLMETEGNLIIHKPNKRKGTVDLEANLEDTHKFVIDNNIQNTENMTLTTSPKEEVVIKFISNSVPLNKKLPPIDKKQKIIAKPSKKIKPSAKIHPSSSPSLKLNKQANIILRLLKYNRDEFWLITAAIAISAIHGAVYPIIGMVVANLLEVFSYPEAPDFFSRASFLSLMFFILTIASCLCNTIQPPLFQIVSNNLANSLRVEIFKKYVKMPIQWFDNPKNAPSILATNLAIDAMLTNTLTCSYLCIIVQAFSSMLTSLVVSLTATWKLGLITFVLSPIVLISGKVEATSVEGFSAQTDESYKDSIAFVGEAVNNMRTVASFGTEEALLKSFSKQLDKPLKSAIRKGNLAGIAFGSGQCLLFLMYAILFYLGAIFTRDDGLHYKDMMQAIFSVVFAAQHTGYAFSFAPDIAGSKAAAKRIFKILDEQPKIDIDDPSQTVKKRIKGHVIFKNVWFTYPGRNKQILKGLNLEIKPSSKVALVGPSGCGKSTVLALLQRFYDPDRGEILIDGVNIKMYDLQHLRRSFGVVSQEPVLFNGSIQYNIKYF